MAGYWNRPDETASVLRDGGSSGDIAYIDSDGYLTIVERKKDLIKHNGFSVTHGTRRHPLRASAVKQCAVVGKADTQAGEIPVAFVVLKESVVASAEEIKSYVNGKVAAYKAVREVAFIQELPINAAGKVLKRNLRVHN
jgi:long-chain acyl-CoA synthetase